MEYRDCELGFGVRLVGYSFIFIIYQLRDLEKVFKFNFFEF